jgi:hypothetical protein
LFFAQEIDKLRAGYIDNQPALVAVMVPLL